MADRLVICAVDHGPFMESETAEPARPRQGATQEIQHEGDGAAAALNEGPDIHESLVCAARVVTPVGPLLRCSGQGHPHTGMPTGQLRGPEVVVLPEEIVHWVAAALDLSASAVCGELIHLCGMGVGELTPYLLIKDLHRCTF